MIWTIFYEYDCLGNGDTIYCLADDWSQAREMARTYLCEEHLWDRVGYRNIEVTRTYLCEEHLWDRVGYRNIEVTRTRHKISAGALLLY